MSETNPPTIAERLAAAGLRVKPLVWQESSGCPFAVPYDVWRSMDHSVWVADIGGPGDSETEVHRGTRADCIAACERHHAEAVLAMLEPIPSEEM